VKQHPDKRNLSKDYCRKKKLVPRLHLTVLTTRNETWRL